MNNDDRHDEPVDSIGDLLDRPIGADELRAQTERFAQPLAVAEEGSESVLLFTIGDDELALPAAAVTSVARPVMPHRIPHRTNDVLRGVCNIAGELVLSVSLGRLLGLTSDPQPDARLAPPDGRTIVVGPPEDRWAFTVDRVVGVATVERSGRITPPLTVDRARGSFTVALVTACTACTDTSERAGHAADSHQAALLDADRLRDGFRAALT